MKFKVFSVSAVGDEESENALNNFLEKHKIIQVDKQLIISGDMNYWSFCICYQNYSNAQKETQNKKPRVDYKELLSEDEFGCFAKLREIRKKEAEKDGVPVFAVFTNEQLAELVRNRVTSIAQMKAIEGIGDSKISRYSDAVLSVLRNHWRLENA